MEAARVIELMDMKEVEGLAETMFKGYRLVKIEKRKYLIASVAIFILFIFPRHRLTDMPDKERGDEEARLKGYAAKFQEGLGKIKDARNKFGIK